MNGNRKRLFEATFVLQAFQLIRADDQVMEVRVLGGVVGSGGWPTTLSGYFDDPVKLIEALKTLRAAVGIYITVNPVNPDLQARAHNRLRKAPKGETTSDGDIISRRWLLVDVDPRRQAGISATDDQHALALKRTREVRDHLVSMGWPEPIVADSGNGGHLMFRIDLPTDDGGLVQRTLAALASQFSCDQVKIDSGVFNPARIWKLYGTLACKGDDTPERPHRMANIISVPEEPEILSAELLEKLADQRAALAQPNNSGRHANGGSFDIDLFIGRHALETSGPEPWNGHQGAGRRWVLTHSPLCDHHDGAAYILQHGSGALSAGCHHDSCSWTWQDLRRHFEPVDNTTAKSKISAENGGIVSASALVSACSAVAPYIPFPVTALPAAVGEYVQEVATAIGCDPSFVALPTLCCLARAIGNSRVIRLKQTWTEPAILWAAIVGKSGTHKSPALKMATAALEQKQADAVDEYRQAMSEFAELKAEYDRQYAHWKRSKVSTCRPVEPIEPQCRRYIVSDITIEALAERLDGQFDGVLVVRDELAGWLNGIGEYKAGKSSDNGHWLASWSGAPMTFDRKTAAKKMIRVPRAAVSIVGGIQPGILRSAIGREHLQDGLCARLLMAMPVQRPVRWTETILRPATETIISEVYDHLLALEPAADAEGRPQPFPIDLTQEARRVWINYFNAHREQQAELDDDLAAAWSKLEAYTARFALIFQLCSWAAGEAKDDAVDEQSLKSAITVSDWFGNEARRVYAVMAEDVVEQEERELLDLIGRHGGEISTRDLSRSSRRYGRSEDAEAALEVLAKAKKGYWRPVPPGPQGGKPTRVLRLVDSADVDNTP